MHLISLEKVAVDLISIFSRRRIINSSVAQLASASDCYLVLYLVDIRRFVGKFTTIQHDQIDPNYNKFEPTWWSQVFCPPTSSFPYILSTPNRSNNLLLLQGHVIQY